MARKGHRKSRGGCFECKRRHVKCDEGRPLCQRCITSGRECSYSLTAPRSWSNTNSPRGLPEEADSLSKTPSLSTRTASSPYVKQSTISTEIDVQHLELFYNYEHSTCRTVARDPAHTELFRATMMTHAFKHQFLLQAVLACSAQHLSIQRPEQAHHYRESATLLQSSALNGFRTFTTAGIDTTNVLDVLLFQHVIALHVFSDAFTSPHQDFNHLLERLISCIRLLRGINAIVKPWWSTLVETDIGALIQSSHVHTNVTPHPRYGECADIYTRISQADLSPASIETCLQAVSTLQWSMNAENSLDDEASMESTNMLFRWPIEASAEYIDLLEQRRPEALVVLAYYTVLLHRRRKSWAVGDAGWKLLGQIRRYLGSSWEMWLSWPLSVVNGATDFQFSPSDVS